MSLPKQSEKDTGIETAKTDHESMPDKDLHHAAIRKAQAATEKEHKMGLFEGVRLYPKAVAWSMIISLCIAMEGFDTSLLNTFFAIPSFNKKFGVLDSKGNYEVPARWQSGLTNGSQCGQILGLLIHGIVSERYGYRVTVIGCLILLSGFIAIYFTATSLNQILAASILCGIPFGVFQTLTISYASEVCPVALRGYLTTWVNTCWGVGEIIAIGAIKGTLPLNNDWSYRIPWSLQWMWPLPLGIAVFMAPESPWWLVRKGRIADAKKSLLRLTSLNRETDFDADETIAMMAHTTALEQEITSGGSYLDCFKGVDLRRTEVVCLVWGIQNLSGNSFSGYSTYFLEQAGLNASKSLDFTLGNHAINIVGVFGAWYLMKIGIGRRALYFYGLIGLFTMLLILGFLGLPKDRNSASLATGAIMIIWACFYQVTVGTVCYSLVAEIPTRRLQIKTVALGRAAYNIVAIVCNVLTPYMLNPSSWDWGNYAGFFWAGTCFFSIIYTYYRIPEPSGRTYAEMDLLFERGISARNFHKTEIDVFTEEVHGGAMETYEHNLLAERQVS